jgi:AcrR family transcriptional regulator
MPANSKSKERKNHAGDSRVEESRPRRGRPRSDASEQAILTAALDLMADGHGPAAITVSAIAKRAGAGKDTIYRRWPNKEDLLLDALASQRRPLAPTPDGSLRDALIVPLAELIELMQDGRARRITQGMNGAGSEFPKLHDRYHQQVIEPRREHLRMLINTAIERGELSPHGDPAQIAMMPYAAVIMAALEDKPIPGNPREAAEGMVDSILDGLRPRPDSTLNTARP